MQNRRRLALAGIGLLAFGVSEVQVAFSDRVVKSVIHDLLATSVGAPCHIDDVEFSFKRGLEVTGLEILDPTHPTARTILTVERAALDFRLGLFGHGLRIDSIELDGATVQLSRQPDGTFPISAVQLPDRRDAPRPDERGPPAPDIRIRSGRLTYRDAEFLAGDRAISIENITGGLLRDPPGLPSFTPQPHLVRVTGDADVLGRVTISGMLAPYLDPHRFDVELARIELDESLSRWLAPKYAEAIQNVAPQGAISLSLHAEGRTVEDTHVVARLDLKDVSCSVSLPNEDTSTGPHPDFDGRELEPVALSGISGQVVVNGDTASVDGVTGRLLGTTVTLSGTADGVRTDPSDLKLDVRAELLGLRVSSDLDDRLPYSVMSVIKAYGLDVNADAVVQLARDADGLAVQTNVTVHSGRASYRGYVSKKHGRRQGFPWQVEIDSGSVHFDQRNEGRLQIDVRGHHGDSQVLVKGDVTHPADGPSRVTVGITAENVELGDDLRDGFEDRAEKMFDRWTPSGVAKSIHVDVFNAPGEADTSTHTDVIIAFDGRATFIPRELPTPLTITSGEVKILTPLRGGKRVEEVRIEDLVANGQGFQLSKIAGTFVGSGVDTEESLGIAGTCTDVGLALRDALQQASVLGSQVKDALKRIHPGGAMDFDVRLDASGGKRSDNVVVTLKRSTIAGFGNVPLAATDLTGVVTVADDAITLGQVSGEVLGARVTVDGHLDGPDSVPTLDIAAKDLPLGPRLRATLGPLGERAAPFFEQLQPTDTTRADVDVKVRPPGGSDPELLLDLTRLRGPVRPLDLPMSTTDGAVHYDGKLVTAWAAGRISDAEVKLTKVRVDLETQAVGAHVVTRKLRFPEDLLGLLSTDAVATLGDLAPGRSLHTPGLDLQWDPATRQLTLNGEVSVQRSDLPEGAERGLDLVGGLELAPLRLTFPKSGGTAFEGELRGKGLSLTPGLELTRFSGNTTLSGQSGIADTTAGATDENPGTTFTFGVTEAEFTALDRRVKEAAFQLSLRAGITRVEDLVARLNGGALTGRVVAGGPGFSYRGNLKLVDASAERVLGVEPERNMGGRLDLDLAFRNPDGARRNLRGEGDVRIVEANLAEIPLITAFSGPFEVGAFTETNAQFDLEGQRILIREANVEGNLLSVRAGSGSVDLDGDRPIDLVATVHAGPSGMGPLDLLWRAIGNTILRVRVTGTLRNPRPQGQFVGFLNGLFGSSDVPGPGPRPVDPPMPSADYPW
jgi:hypothetical protein